MTSKKTNWTPQQLAAISTRDSDILVTASAGTGKTAVLSARCIDILKSGCDVLNLLVLTFTELAAEEMRSRIADQLRKAYLENGDKRLRTQLMLLPAANISTIHSFCKKLVSEYFYRLDLDPAFGIVEPDQQKLIKNEVLEKTIEWAWDQENLRSAMELLLKGRDLRLDNGFLTNIIQISQFLEGLVSRDKWHNYIDDLFSYKNINDTSLAAAQKQIIRQKLNTISQQLSFAKTLCTNQGCDSKLLKKFEEKFVAPIENLKEIFDTSSWNNFAAAIDQFVWPTRIALKDIDPSANDVYKSVIDSAKKNFNDISSLAILNPDYIRQISSSADLQVKLIAELVKKFDELYSKAKRSINCLDFADLEHYALQILTIQQDDKLIPSDIALTLREKFKHIFVDEYQDINPVQQAILDSLSKGRNVFVVGDVKQSIYAFRGAEPGIFLADLNAAAQGQTDCIKIDLNANFRSRHNILQCVNTIFEKIMTENCCGLNYDTSAILSAGTDEQKISQTLPIEMHILDEQTIENDSDDTDSDSDQLTATNDWAALTPAKRQAAMIARRIKQMVTPENGQPEFEIFDKAAGKYRPVEYRDIVILMRSPAGKAEDYVEVLRLAGVPVSTQLGGGYFQATEIADCLSLLKVLDNRHRDIELAAILRSPFFKLTDTCLAKIKLSAQPDKSCTGFYNMLKLYCQTAQDENLKNKLIAIMDQLDNWALLAKTDTLSNLIWQIYRKTGYLSFVSALPGGQARRANLLKLHDLAIQFAKFNGKNTSGSLSRFVEFVEKAQDAQQNWSTAKPQTHAENNVRILSVHSSKGLEFSIVFLAELNTKFNTSDLSGDLLVNSADTIGLKIIDHENKTKLSSIAHQVIAEKKSAMSLAEELRILYVALTRAKDKLILTASAKSNKCAEILNKAAYFENNKIPDWAISQCKQPLDWILYGLSRQSKLHHALQIKPTSNIEKDLIDVTIYNEADLAQLSNYLQQLKENKTTGNKTPQFKSDSDLLTKVKNSLDWQYPFEGASKIRAKDSVTNLAHPDDEFLKIDYSDALASSPKAMTLTSSGQHIDSASIGTATHLLIASLNLKKTIDIPVIEQVKQNLIAAGRLSQNIAEHIDIPAIAGFFETQLGKKILSSKRFWQEWQFTFGLNPNQLANNPANDNQIIVVQGVIDLLAETNEGFLIIDFKTDRITPDQTPSRAETYRPQLTLYRQAVQSIFPTQKPIENWLYFLHPRTPFNV